MRRSFLALGIILLFVGVITFSVSYTPDESEINETVDRKENLPIQKWRISGEFDKGERLFVVFSAVDPENAIVDSSAVVDVNITSPSGGNTTFRVLFTDTFRPDINISLKSKDEDNGLVVSSPLEGIGGEAEYDGMYTAHVYAYLPRLFYPPDGTLPWLELYRTVVERKYPYTAVLPVGIALIIAGVSLSIWAAGSSAHPSRSRKG